MKKIEFLFLALFATMSPHIKAQQAPEGRPTELSVSFGLGFWSGTDLLDRYLSQDLDGYDHYQYRLGILAAVQYRWSRRWGTAFIWNSGGTTAKKDASFFGSHGKYKKRTTSFQSFSLIFERRFSIRPNRYFYWGFGLGTVQQKVEKTPSLSTESVEKTTHWGITPQIKPIGMCYDAKRVKTFLEMGLFSLPLVTGGIKVQL